MPPKSINLVGSNMYWQDTVGLQLRSPFLHMGTMYTIDCLDEGSDYIVFDDCDPDHLHSHYKCWIGAQDQFSATDKYRAKRSVKWGKPCIWLSNSDPRDSHQWDRDWVDSNALVINLTHKLYEPVPINYMHPENGLFVGI